MCGGYRVTAESCVTVTAPSRPHCYTITVLHFTCDTITPYTLHITTLHITLNICIATVDHTHAAVTLDITILSLFYLGDKNNLPELIFIRSRHCQGGCWCWPQLKLEIIKRELYFYCIFLH